MLRNICTEKGRSTSEESNKDKRTADADFLGVKVGLVADRCLTPLSLELCERGVNTQSLSTANAHLSAGHLSDSFWVFLDVLFATAAGVTGTDEFGVVLEAGGDCFAAVGVALYELDHLCFFFVGSPFLEGGKVGEDEGVAVVGVAGAIGGTRGGRFGGCRRGRGVV